MIKDIFAIIGLIMILFGVYFVYWPLCLILGGILITSYCVVTVWMQTKRDKENEFN